MGRLRDLSNNQQLTELHFQTQRVVSSVLSSPPPPLSLSLSLFTVPLFFLLTLLQDRLIDHSGSVRSRGRTENDSIQCLGRPKSRFPSITDYWLSAQIMNMTKLMNSKLQSLNQSLLQTSPFDFSPERHNQEVKRDWSKTISDAD